PCLPAATSPLPAAWSRWSPASPDWPCSATRDGNTGKRWLARTMPASVPDHPAVNEAMQYCSACGKTVTSAIPDGDNRLRAICTACGTMHYQNPKIVAGCVPEHEGRILLCRRAIEPRRGFWTVPAGFMELGETLAEAALRETWEEAL